MQLRHHDWVEPLEVAAGLAGRDWTLCLLSDGSPGARWSYLMADPVVAKTVAAGEGDFGVIDALVAETGAGELDTPPFSGGLAGLAAYDLGAREATGREVTEGDWPDLMLARYDAVLAFDHHQRRVIAMGRSADGLGRAQGWLVLACAIEDTASPLAQGFEGEEPPSAYRDAVSDVVSRIAAGELFQANIARAWSGSLVRGAAPFDVFARLARTSPAPFAAFWSLPGRALVSNSPEAFLSIEAGSRRIESRPIKGTRPRRADPVADTAEAEALLASAKDRAENLMIVDLMRNDLSRICETGSVAVPDLFRIESFPTVHHLVSTIAGTVRNGLTPAQILEATFPPGSITGAPKHQAMKVIAGHEAARGPWCGSLFLAGDDGAMNASVLIRTLAFERTGDEWQFRTLAGAGIVADSDPQAELDETDAKIAAIRRALSGDQAV